MVDSCAYVIPRRILCRVCHQLRVGPITQQFRMRQRKGDFSTSFAFSWSLASYIFHKPINNNNNDFIEDINFTDKWFSKESLTVNNSSLVLCRSNCLSVKQRKTTWSGNAKSLCNQSPALLRCDSFQFIILYVNNVWDYIFHVNLFVPCSAQRVRFDRSLVPVTAKYLSSL